MKQARRQVFLRGGGGGGMIQRGDGPNVHQRREPLGGCGGMLPWKFLKIRLSENAFVRFEGSII